MASDIEHCEYGSFELNSKSFSRVLQEPRRLPLSHFVNRLEMLTFFAAFSPANLTGFLAYVREDGLKH